MPHTRAKRRAAARDMARDEIFSGESNDDRDMLSIAAASYNPERHDEDSVFFDNSYTGPSERELSGGCNRCGGFDDCYCPDPPTKKERRDYEATKGPRWDLLATFDGLHEFPARDKSSRNMAQLLSCLRMPGELTIDVKLVKHVDGYDDREYMFTIPGTRNIVTQGLTAS